MYLEWPDISFTTKTLTIHSKPALGFRIKGKEERSMPVPDDLLKRLKKYKRDNPEKSLSLETRRTDPKFICCGC
ncbi:hypothetical protein [Tunturiibacter gelidiferens]|uniref:hypothetical protein n=1 Tax=Tunturiibacter gelidiferens TaxID=3069689 RepID=UPI003D9ABF3E